MVSGSYRLAACGMMPPKESAAAIENTRFLQLERSIILHEDRIKHINLQFSDLRERFSKMEERRSHDIHLVTEAIMRLSERINNLSNRIEFPQLKPAAPPDPPSSASDRTPEIPIMVETSSSFEESILIVSVVSDEQLPVFECPNVDKDSAENHVGDSSQVEESSWMTSLVTELSYGKEEFHIQSVQRIILLITEGAWQDWLKSSEEIWSLLILYDIEKNLTAVVTFGSLVTLGGWPPPGRYFHMIENPTTNLEVFMKFQFNLKVANGSCQCGMYTACYSSRVNQSMSMLKGGTKDVFSCSRRELPLLKNKSTMMFTSTWENVRYVHFHKTSLFHTCPGNVQFDQPRATSLECPHGFHYIADGFIDFKLYTWSHSATSSHKGYTLLRACEIMACLLWHLNSAKYMRSMDPKPLWIAVLDYLPVYLHSYAADLVLELFLVNSKHIHAKPYIEQSQGCSQHKFLLDLYHLIVQRHDDKKSVAAMKVEFLVLAYMGSFRGFHANHISIKEARIQSMQAPPSSSNLLLNANEFRNILGCDSFFGVLLPDVQMLGIYQGLALSITNKTSNSISTLHSSCLKSTFVYRCASNSATFMNMDYLDLGLFGRPPLSMSILHVRQVLVVSTYLCRGCKLKDSKDYKPIGGLMHSVRQTTIYDSIALELATTEILQLLTGQLQQYYTERHKFSGLATNTSYATLSSLVKADTLGIFCSGSCDCYNSTLPLTLARKMHLQCYGFFDSGQFSQHLKLRRSIQCFDPGRSMPLCKSALSNLTVTVRSSLQDPLSYKRRIASNFGNLILTIFLEPCVQPGAYQAKVPMRHGTWQNLGGSLLEYQLARILWLGETYIRCGLLLAFPPHCTMTKLTHLSPQLPVLIKNDCQLSVPRGAVLILLLYACDHYIWPHSVNAVHMTYSSLQRIWCYDLAIERLSKLCVSVEQWVRLIINVLSIVGYAYVSFNFGEKRVTPESLAQYSSFLSTVCSFEIFFFSFSFNRIHVTATVNYINDKKQIRWVYRGLSCLRQGYIGMLQHCILVLVMELLGCYIMRCSSALILVLSLLSYVTGVLHYEMQFGLHFGIKSAQLCYLLERVYGMMKRHGKASIWQRHGKYNSILQYTTGTVEELDNDIIEFSADHWSLFDKPRELGVILLCIFKLLTLLTVFSGVVALLHLQKLVQHINILLGTILTGD